MKTNQVSSGVTHVSKLEKNNLNEQIILSEDRHWFIAEILSVHENREGIVF
jgi:hypothetical protein